MQRELFKPRELDVKPTATNGPRLWFRRLVIWGEPDAKPIQDIEFGPGLNIIWSPDPADRSARDDGEVPPGPGHGAGKTLVCRLLRYCLGEPHFASDVLRSKISSAFKDGRVGVELIVDGAEWVVVRSIGVFGHDVVLEGGTLEAAVSSNTAPTGIAPLIDMLVERFLTADVAALVTKSREGEEETEAQRRAWLFAIAWLTRDQECHFGKATEWRAAASESGSPARRLSVGDANNVVRALLGAITPREHRLEAEVEKLGRRREDEGRGIERRRWLIEQSLKRILRAVELEGKPLPEGDLLGQFLRNAARVRVAQVAVVDAKGELASVDDLEAKYESERKEVERLEAELSSAETKRSTAEAVAKQIASETPGLTASLDEAEIPTCPVCEVPIDRVLAEGCKLSHKLPDVESLRQRQEKNQRDLRDKKAEQAAAEEALKRLGPQLKAATTRRDKAWADLRAARRQRDARTEVWYAARRIGDDVGDLEKLLTENAEAEKTLADIDTTLKQRREAAGAERDQHGQVFARLGQHFDPLVRRLLGPKSEATGRVQHDGNGLNLVVEYGGERSTPAINLVKVLAFDLATLCRSIEGATKLPPLLIHDSPRSSDLGLSIYHELFHVVRELEKAGSGPQFQYIVTTTSRPPDDLVGDKRVRLKLNGSPAEARLLRRDL
ncbi:chromosome segregation protein SMC [Polyangium fumosum]|uniref:Chromosome segregation protein SMC n=1 Tax=Polyangium fumosum TaxID=889272 RepID=A0A4U1J7P8_9BACT|nr:chromosome segregation protein SMC [Polyangium fumosum]TKD03418.1 chromosome segregation protein SMC [Polyangium fumosum]